MKVPSFALPDSEGFIHTTKQYAGKWLVVYFYPKDDTPGCTKEACSVRDEIEEFRTRGVSIVGISKDSVVSHKKFADKHNLNFPILSDESTDIIKAFGAWGMKKFMGKSYEGIKRNTYVINPDGEIVKKFENVNPLTHTSTILAYLDTVI